SRGIGWQLVNISEPFIRRPVATSLLMAALAFTGIVAYPFLPVAPLPQVDFPTIQVTANFQGGERGDDGLLRRRAARAAARADSGCHPADVDERAWRHDDRHSVRSQPQHRLGGTGRAGGDHRREQDVAATNDRATELQE